MFLYIKPVLLDGASLLSCDDPIATDLDNCQPTSFGSCKLAVKLGADLLLFLGTAEDLNPTVCSIDEHIHLLLFLYFLWLLLLVYDHLFFLTLTLTLVLSLATRLLYFILLLILYDYDWDL